MSTLGREAMLELVAAYALGVLPAAEHAFVAGFILSDADARREFAELRATANFVGLSAEEPVDSARAARMKERLMESVRSDVAPRRNAPSATRRSAMWGTTLAAAAAVVFALVSVIQNFGLRSDLHEAQLRVATLQTGLENEHKRLALDRTVLTDLTANDARRYTVAYGTVVQHGANVYFALGALPSLPKGKVYQAWTLAKGAKLMTPSVTFAPAASGITLVPIPDKSGSIAAVGLTVEPEGGSRQPTTKPAFLQPLS
jgi:anti-sigma-K factor RskA